MTDMNSSAPWLAFYGDVPHTLEVPGGTMFEQLAASARRTPDEEALFFEGASLSYAKLEEDVLQCARAFLNSGIRSGDRVLLCMPNIPQNVLSLYALNRIGAVPCMVHPLCSRGELRQQLALTGCRHVVTLDALCGKFLSPEPLSVDTLIVTGIADALPPLKAMLYALTQKNPRLTDSPLLLPWRSFLQRCQDNCALPPLGNGEDLAAILFSGGTTGTLKGILLSNTNLNAMAAGAAAMAGCLKPCGGVLAALPMFHGFGLGVGVHMALMYNQRCVLVPRFSLKAIAQRLVKQKAGVIAGVPTLFEAMMVAPKLQKADLSFMAGVFCGGDTMPAGLKKRMDAFLAAHGASVPLREGYGLTESVTVNCLMPPHLYREGSIGLPLPGMSLSIVRPGTTETLPCGEEGEICVSGPTVMMGYLNNEAETRDALKIHGDGNIWLHTGDVGMMDADGFFYFRQRIKRMIISSGYNIYPAQLEAIFAACDGVASTCVIGVPDPKRGQAVKAFVVLEPDVSPSGEIKNIIHAHCAEHIASYSLPREIVFIDKLPQTRMGKIDFTALEKWEA